ncbi:uncharacterized protein LOC142765701 [Rhipicephalus microplus]|uniref:uncharacterized protein LOC142765701 n=1 Tax=Rhipicephalus microplus TaxID=6941 RepID=UPI003F6CF58A
MLTSRLLLALLLLTTLATLPSPSDGTFFGGGSLGAYLLPAALIGLPLPLGPLALGIGLAGIKVAIFTRVLSFLAGVLGSRGDGKRGITVRKEFVHVPAKNIHRAIRPLVGPPPWPRTLEHPPLLGPQSYGFPGGIPPTAFAETVFSPFEVPIRPPLVFPEPSKFASPPPPPSFQFVFPPAPPQPEVRRRPSQFLSPDKILQGAQPATGGTFDQLLHIAQSPAVSNIVSNNPDLVVKFLRGIVGAKPLQTPIGTAHSTAGLTGSKIGGGDIEALLNFVREDPNLVRNIVRADPQFVPSLVNNILGIPGEGGRQPTPAPPANFSGFDFNQSSNGTEGGDKSPDNVPANVPIDTAQDKPLTLPFTAPKSASKLPTSFQSQYSFQSYPPNFYSLANYGPSPYKTYGFPAGFGGPQRPAGLFSAPWRPPTPQGINVPKFTNYINQATELTYGNTNRLKKQQSTKSQVPVAVAEKPQTAPVPVVTTEEPAKSTLDAYGSVRKVTPKTPYATNVTPERPVVLQSYGPVQKDKPKTTSTTAFTTPRPPKRPSVPAYTPAPESSRPKEQPLVQTQGPTKAKPSYQGEVVTKVPATQGYETPSRTSRPGPSYTPSSTGQAGTLTKSIVVTAEKPVVEQDLPIPRGTEGDIYFSGVQDEQISPFGSDRPTPKKTAGPPPVRPVFVPATGKFRPGKDERGRPEVNVGSFPASLFHPTSSDGQDTKNSAASSHISGSAKPRARRDTSSASAMTDLMKLFDPRTMDNRKCVFKMVCFIGANDHTLGRTKFGDSIARVLRYMDDTVLNGGDDLAAAYNAAYEVGRTHGGEGCRIKYNSCPMTVVDLVSLSANFG